uniref:GAG-pre-integrase domain-containing protein n=1 Tax=Tanacetum cinerariifolium TaxID=118510 RepID=A0A6L2JKH2_TANCI|nr:hypothetical protein [Tanacetum cinerariifolium]
MILNVGSVNELDKSKLWHSRVGHVNKKCIAQLQKDGVLESFDFKSDDVCESCLLGKITKSPFTGTCKRVNIDTQQEVVTSVEPDDISLPIHKTSSRVSKPLQDPQFYYGFHIEEDKISNSTLTELNEPANYKEAMEIPEATKLKEAMKSEIRSMYDNQLWNLFNTTPSLKTVRCKWIFKKKANMDGKVHTYKARVTGYCDAGWQTDKDDSRSQSGWMDVKTAFFNRKLTEDVFMVQPEGFENENQYFRVLNMYNLTDIRNLPLHHGIKISKDLCPKTDDEPDKMSRVPYASSIGSIMYVMTCTRPDVSFALSMVSLHQQNPSEVQDPIEIFSDNESAAALTKEPKDHEKSKHIERKYHFVRSKVEEGHVIVKDIRSEDNPADPFTKKDKMEF